jgi:mono/diheme cytochrome c family protein
MCTARWRVVILLGLAAASGCNLPGKPSPNGQAVRPEQVRDFGTLYSQNCAGCHGADGRLGPAPPLNDPLFLTIVPDADLLRTVAEGRALTPMPPFDQARGGPLTAEQVRILAEGIKQRWQLASVSPGAVPAYQTSGPDCGDAERGKTVFARACAGCHGDQGKGGVVNGRTIGSIHDEAFLSLCSDQVLRRFVITGRPDLGMPDFADPSGRPAGFQPLSPQDVDDLVALLADWRKNGAAGGMRPAAALRGASPVP